VNQKTIRQLIILAVAALSGLLIVQVVWFRQAYELQQRYFAEKANSALNLTALNLNHDAQTPPSVFQTSANTFTVKVNSCLNEDSLPNLLQRAFATYGTSGDYDVAVNDCSNEAMLMNYNFKSYAEGAPLPNKLSLQNEPCYYLNVTFREKQKTLMQEMWFWVFSAVCCVLVLVFFAYSLYVLMKEKRLAEMKKDFINNMTHELKTPIANIAVASDLLKNQQLNLSAEKIQNYASIIQKENERLKGQVERVLTMAFLEERTIDLKRESLNINELVEDISRNFALRIGQRKGKIQVKTDAIQPVLNADKFHLSNVIYSLLDNADKYSPTAPNITLTTENTSKGLRVTVADAGIGIDPSLQRLVFDKFYRVPTGDVHNVKGFGLGLSYAKMIVAAHGGAIGVESELGRGSRFFLDF
jgi:two-component system, OmpR family, phosphate regulon sensor histidine kinase PhoR